MKESRISLDSWIRNRPIAHRGLHSEGVPENSYAAFGAAVEKNYPIEMDVQMTKDGVLVVFHDDNMKRMTGEDCIIWDKTYEELQKMTLGGTTEKIPLFNEFLDFIGGRVPLMIEIKNQREKGIEKKVVDLLKAYNGEFAVQSFNPFIVKELKKLAPEFIRGQLVTLKRQKRYSALTNFILHKMLLNAFTKPDFINMDVRDLPISPKHVKNRVRITWTIRTQEEKEKAEQLADNYIFEDMIV